MEPKVKILCTGGRGERAGAAGPAAAGQGEEDQMATRPWDGTAGLRVAPSAS